MSFQFKSGSRYRMPVVFGPAPGPRQKPDGTPWTEAETGIMNSQWMSVHYRTHREKLEKLLPPGFVLRGEPIVTAQLSYFNNLFWLAGRSYGIALVDVPVTYTGKVETIEGKFCLVLWEGIPDAIMTGREELGFPKLFANIPPLDRDMQRGRLAGSASWFDHRFMDLEVHDLVEVEANKGSPGSGGAHLYYKYMPRTGSIGEADVGYVTTSAPPPGADGASKSVSSIDFDKFQIKRWKAQGSVSWNRATFAQLPTTFHVVNGLADLDILEYVGAEYLEFSGPGISVNATRIRPVETV